MSEAEPNKVGVFSQVFPSLGIGALVGVLVGMSVSPVVASFLSALGGLLAALLGLQDGGPTEGAEASVLARFRLNGLRIGTFGFACVAGVLFGVYLRANDAFAVPVKAQIANWEEAGYSKEEARQYVVFQKLGIKPEGKEFIAGGAPKGESVLYGALADIDLCNKVSMQRLGNDVQEVLAAYRRLDQGNEQDKLTPLYKELGAMAGTIERLPSGEQRGVLQSIEGVLCQVQRLDQE